MMGPELLAASRVVALAVVWLALFVAWIRVVVGPLWGSASDLGLLGAVVAASAGIVALTWLGVALFRIATADFQQPSDPEENDVEL